MQLNICYTVGGNSWIPCYVSLYSVLVNNQDLSISVYILSEEDQNNPFFEEIEFLYDKHPDVDIQHIPINESEFNELPNPGKHLSYGVYFRLAIHRLCPANGTVLHLDADTICDGSLVDLMSVDMGNSTLAAVPNGKPDMVRLDTPIHRPKLNAGVLLINLEQWRINNVEQRTRDYIRNHEPEFNDQDAINKLLNKDGTTKYIAPEYNATKKWLDDFDRSDREPTIIHYNGPDKPWRYVTQRNGEELWWKYADQTPFKNYETDKSIKKITWVKLRRILNVFYS